MTKPDVLAELDAWLATARRYAKDPDNDVLPIQRARDEIAALRKRCDALQSLCERQLRDPVGFSKEFGAAVAAEARAETLEAAAELCDERGLMATAADIRALKGQEATVTRHDTRTIQA